MTRTAQSQRKKRQAARPLPPDALEERIVKHVREAAAAHGVLAVESEFAGYFNQLGFTVVVAEETSGDAMVALGNALLDSMAQVTAGVDLPFTWTIGIYRGDELVRVVSPGDAPSVICRNCWEEQRVAGPSCAVCSEPL
jgi:hypothetical protein